MIKHLRFIYLLLLTITLGTNIALAQTTFGSEEELKTQAAKLFDDDDFEEAYPLYSQLASIYPKDPNFNYRLGVCMLYASDDKEKPVSFLEFAAGKPDVEKEVFFYLAKAYHLNYRFDDAIKQYQAYQKVASAAKAEKLMVDRQIEMCKSGKKLLRNLTDLVVIDKKEMSRVDFFRSYDISGIGGKLLVKPDEESFKSALDKKKKEKSIIYLATNNNQVFFSSYGDDLERGKDIYIIRKLPTGEWSKPQTLGYPVNTEYDEDYPFLHPNGKVLYFCSKGHNSMGGYDVFKTTLNEETNTWNKPVNLDFPINTPDDDIMYVTNEDEKEAYFSSARSSKTGKTAVYHINVERKPIDVAIIKGAVVKNRDNQPLDVKITVKDLNDNVILGIFNSKAANGVYLINIPNGGKFSFTVEATGFATQSEVVEVPVQYTFRPMKQEISYELGTDKLIIKNLFDEVMDDASYLLAMSFIKERSKMDVNANDATPGNTTATSVKDTALASKTTSGSSQDNSTTAVKLTNNDIVKIGYADAEEVAKEAKDLKEQADIALLLANQKNELAQNKAKEAAQLIADASRMTDNVKKQATMDEAELANKEAEELNQETVAAFNLAKKIEFRASAKDQEAELSMQYAKDLEAAVKSKNADPALFARLDEQQKKLDALGEQNNNPTLANSLKMDVDNKKRELDKAVKTVEDIKQEIADNETLIVTTQAEADKEKNANVKQGLIDQVIGLKADTEDSKAELAQVEIKVAQLQKDYNGVVNETQMIASVFDQAKTGTSEKAAADIAMVDITKLEQNVNVIKSTVATPDNGTSTNATKTSDGVVTATKTTDKTAATANNTAQKEAYDKKFSDDLAATSGILNELERENKKAELYSNWTASINEDIAAKKLEAKNEKDNTKKKELNNEVAALEKELKEKQKATDISLASLEKLKKEAALADNTITTTTPVNATGTGNNTEAGKDYSKKYSDDLAATAGISSELERENKKAELYSNWTTSINEDIVTKKLEAKNEKDNTKKKELNNEIAALEKELKEKQTASDASLATVEKLKKETALADNTTAATTPDNTTSAGNNTEEKKDYGKKYSDDLAATAAISNELDRENKKAELYTNWIASINEDIAAKKAEIKTEEDKTKKKELTKEVTALEKELKEKQKTSTATIATVEKLKKDGAVSSATTTDNTQGSSDNATLSTTEINKKYTEELAGTGTITNEADRELAKAATLQNWSKAIDTGVIKKKQYLEATDDPEMKALLEMKIKQEEQLSKDKQAEANQSLAKAERINNPALATTNTTTTNDGATTTKTPDNTNTTTTNGNDVVNTTTKTPDTGTEPTTNNGISENKFVYTSTAASEQVVKAKVLDQEAENLITQSNELKSKAAAENNASTKTAAYAEAEELAKQAENKKVESSGIVALANKSEYNTNQNKLEQFATATQGNNTDDISMAEMMKDEAVIFYNRAEKSRALAASSTVYYEKETALEDAYKNEMIALEKQKKASDLYRKYTPDVVANNTTTIPDNTTSDVAVTNTTKTPDNNTTTTTTPDNTTSDVAVTNATKTPDNNTTTTTPDNTTSDVAVTNATKAPDNNATTTTTPDNTTSDVAVTNTTKAPDNTTTTTPDNTTSDVAVSNTTKTPDNTKTTSTSVNTTAVSSEQFISASAPVYSAAKPIPVNEKLPEGLIFKVQIGAFRKPIPQDLFKGMSPITGETTTQGFIRYTAGLFTKFSTANKVKDEIRDLGYKDAFVVAFLNGKRISIIEALAMVGENAPVANQTTADNTTTTNVVTPNTTTAENNTVPSNNTTTTSTAGVNTGTQTTTLAATQNISSVEGLFYTVQVGVYSQPVPASKLYNIQPLYTEIAPNGNLRYNTGIYNNIGRASEAKNMAIDAGIKDAFVTAYYNGKRISIPEAAQLGANAFTTAPNMNAMPTFTSSGQRPSGTVTPPRGNTVVPPVTQPETSTANPVITTEPMINPVITNEPQTTTVVVTTPIVSEEIKAAAEASNVMPIDSGIVFKVQIGAFKDEVPLTIANKFLKVAEKGVRNYKDANGLTIYTVGNYKTYEEANQVKAEVAVEAEITDAFVIAYKDGIKISIEEAKTLIGN